MEKTEHPQIKLIINFPHSEVSYSFVTAKWVNTENPLESFVVDSRISRSGFEACELNKKKEGVSVECKNRDFMKLSEY